MNSLDLGAINRTFFEVMKRQTLISNAYVERSAKVTARRKAGGFNKYI